MLTKITRTACNISRVFNQSRRYLRQQNMAMQQQSFDYFVVLDFEATCDNKNPPKPQEIIEFPMLLVSGKTFQVESTFHQYVQPRIHTELTPFCTELTGIIQDMVDEQPFFEDVLKNANTFLLEQGLLEPEVNFIFVTCGDWDLKTMLPSQATYFKVNYPTYFNKWINIKKPYSDAVGKYPRGMMGMLAGLELKHTGRHHSGIDDCNNIAAILRALAERGHIFTQTGQQA